MDCSHTIAMPAQTKPQETELPVMDRPYVPPPQEGPQARFKLLPLSAPWRWLVQGFEDLRASPGIGLFYGTAFWLMAQVLALVFRRSPEYTLSMVSGCLLLGPFLAMGLYEVSRRREQSLPQSLAASLTCWGGHIKSMSMLVLVLMVLELLWGRASLVVFAVFFNTGMPSTTGVVQALFSVDNWEFIAVYSAVGGVFAALVFGSTVVSLPMMLDRGTDAMTAAITSLRVVTTQTGVLVLWGLLIVLLVAAALLVPWQWPLVVVGPWLGCASWHAYRACVGSQPVTAEGAAPATRSPA
jgi:uncharacterized membrane protein